MSIEKQTDLDFGFEAEVRDTPRTISGKEYRTVNADDGYTMNEIPLNSIVTGYPEITIFENNEKNDEGEFVRNYQSVRIRLIDTDEFYDIYANIPRRDEKGFITNISKNYNFYRTGFNFVMSFMRLIDEHYILDDNGDEKTFINKVNIDNVCKRLDSFNYVSAKIIEGATEEYDSFIITDMKNI